MKHSILLACATLAMVSTSALAGPTPIQVQQMTPAQRDAILKGSQYLIDRTAPTLVSTFPATGATGISVAATLRLTFSENVKPGPGGAFHLGWAGGQRDISNTNASQTTISGKNVYLHPPGGMLHHTTYWLTWPQGTVTDMAGNQDSGNGSGTLFRFTTN